MLHRQTEVKFRDNQENRVQQFPKTPKNANVASSKFVTPAPKPRIALGAKSTNVHHRQFSSVKTGKRHSPVIATKKPLSIVAPEEAQKLEGGAALRAALNKALLTGVDIPDVEYTPPPVEELPDDEPDWMHPMDWDAFDKVVVQGRRLPRTLPCYRDQYVQQFDLRTPEFQFMEVPSARTNTKSSSGRPALSSSSSTASIKRTPASKLGGFAAPTLSAQAKAKPSRTLVSTTQGKTVSKSIFGGQGMPSKVPSSLRSYQRTSSTRSVRKSDSSTERAASPALSLSALTEIPPMEIGHPEVQDDFEVDFDI